MFGIDWLREGVPVDKEASVLTDESEVVAGARARARAMIDRHPGREPDSFRLTDDRGWGSCRDFAVLFAEATRSLGFGARVVSGYLYNPNQDRAGSTGAGSTHCWAEVFAPGAGWITFDPTNRIVGGFNLIPVAVARDIRQAMPVSGSFIGSGAAFMGGGV